eukprot:TRINITY_DN66247_c1_g1_i1.p1 TRINITY_DN66247_c1_g1~~TRINITY_DN66247_c1_g1_i1.p1  ORF type:complete len:339 (-),score=78.05 TRINITY_DN66247_c1_g1_i1:179-1195(-)
MLVVSACWLFALMVELFMNGHGERQCERDFALFILVAFFEGLLLLSRAVVLQMSVRTVKIGIVYVVAELALLPPLLVTMRTEGAKCTGSMPITGVMMTVHTAVVLYGLHETRTALHYSRVVQVVWAASGLNLFNISVTVVTFMVDPEQVDVLIVVAMVNAGLDCVLTLYLVFRLWRRRLDNCTTVKRGGTVRPMVSKNPVSGGSNRHSRRPQGTPHSYSQRLSHPNSKQSPSHSSRRGSPMTGSERGQQHRMQLSIMPSTSVPRGRHQTEHDRVAKSPRTKPSHHTIVMHKSSSTTAAAASDSDHNKSSTGQVANVAATTTTAIVAAAGADTTSESPP